MMEKLYKDRYLIAVYDRFNECCYGVYESINQIAPFIDVASLKTIISRAIATYKTFPVIACGKYEFCFIDIFEEHDDIFHEEDVEFLKYYNENKFESVSSFARRKHIPGRTFANNLEKYREFGYCKNYQKEVKEYLARVENDKIIEREI